MPSTKKLVNTALCSALTLSLFLFVAVASCRAQASTVTSDDTYAFGANTLKPWVASDFAVPLSVVPDSVTAEPPTTSDPAGAPPPQAAKSAPDDGWHFAVSPYLWLPGVHGTAFGPEGNGLGFKASASDLLSHFQFGLLGAVEARHKWLITSMDMIWLRLQDDRAIALPPAALEGVTDANIHATLFLLTPKVGVRLINQEKFKVDALTGFRFWHIGDSLNFNPSALGFNFNGSQNFVDPLVGGRIGLALSPKISINILGDVGGWNTGSKLEYQVAGFLGYQIKPAITLQAGYRYLNIDYFGSRGITTNITMSGVLLGATINLK
jgi:hypothetical protein